MFENMITIKTQSYLFASVPTEDHTSTLGREKLCSNLNEKLKGRNKLLGWTDISALDFEGDGNEHLIGKIFYWRDKARSIKCYLIQAFDMVP